jgi:hypothetical protein
MGRINPYQSIIVPTAMAVRPRVQKDRPRQSPQEHSRDAPGEEEKERPKSDDGEPHVDVKA